MLRLARACKCTSTSTSLTPCKHATLSRSYSRKSLPQQSPLPTSAHPHAHSHYTPPTPASTQGGWFEPLQYNRSGFRDWLNHSPSPSSSPSSSQQAPTSRQQQQQDPSSSTTKSTTDSLLNDYLTNRGGGGGRGVGSKNFGFKDEYGVELKLLEGLADEKDLHFLKAMVLEDLSELGKRGGIGNERLMGTGEEEEEHKKEGGLKEVKGLTEMIITPTPPPPQEVANVEKKKQKKVPEEIVDSRAVDSLSSILQQISSSSTSSFTLSQLTEAWNDFISTADLEDSLKDYSQTLSFLHYLLSSSPSPSNAMKKEEEVEDYLPLALEVFSSLVQVLPEDLIATTNDEKLSIRFVLLRTLVNAALDQDLFSISSKALQSIRQPQSEGEEGVQTREEKEEFETKVRITLKGWLGEFKDERIKSYKPNELESSRTSLETLSELIGLLRESRKEGITVIRNQGKKLLDKFVEECAERYRWDLIAKVFREWNGDGGVYELEKYHLKFARWLTGEAPYSTYYTTSITTTPHHRSRQSQPDLFSLFARITHSQLRRPQEQGHSSLIWTLSEKNEWIDLLTVSAGSTLETRSLARRIVSHWTTTITTTPQQAPLSSSPPPFVLRGSTLLNLIRSSLPSTSSKKPLSEERLNFLRSLINNTIQSLISPNSPYSTTNTIENSSSSKKKTNGPGGGGPILNHFDLTTLAQAYSLLGDSNSVEQVYKKLLELKYLPDQKDLELILRSSTMGETGGLELVRQAHKMGVGIGERVVEGLVKKILENEVERRRRRSLKEDKQKKKKRPDDKGWKFKIEEVFKFAREELKFKETGKEMEKLENLVLGFIPLSEPNRLVKLSDSRLLSILKRNKVEEEGISIKIGLGLMKRCFETNSYRLVTRLYQLVLDHSSNSLSPELLTYTLETLLKSSSSTSSSFLKSKILDSLKSTIDSTLSSPHLSALVNNEKNLELTMKGLIKIGEVEAIEKFWQTLAERSIDVDNVASSTKSLVVRWVVGKEGRDKVLNESRGIVGEWAKEILSENPKARKFN
ncbi:hypothetical protein JCM5350_003918 [Sporobolomyces pararoseus]